jgi:DNA-binding response OmpR family regulator
LGKSSGTLDIKKVLLVEDEEGARDALAKILKTYRHEVTSVDTGEDAIKEFETVGGFDIVLTDLTLPGISGWDVAKSVKKASPDTPVIVLSGWDVRKDDAKIAECGVSMVLSKPVKVRDMLSAIENLLGKGQ